MHAHTCTCNLSVVITQDGMVKVWNTEHDAVEHSKQKKKKKVFGIDMARVSSIMFIMKLLMRIGHLINGTPKISINYLDD